MVEVLCPGPGDPVHSSTNTLHPTAAQDLGKTAPVLDGRAHLVEEGGHKRLSRLGSIIAGVTPPSVISLTRPSGKSIPSLSEIGMLTVRECQVQRRVVVKSPWSRQA
jgi:hypothetical protein